MKHLLVNYRSDGVVFENLRIKDYFSIEYTSYKLTTQKLQGEVIQTFQLSELMGFIKIENINFAIVIQESKETCSLQEKKILEVLSIDLLPILPIEQWKSTSSFVKEEVSKVKEMLMTFKLYYSYDLDITLTLQNQQETTFTDPRFFWNESLVSILQPYFAHWIVVFMDGFIKSIPLISSSSKNIQYILISRRDKTRAGLRFSSRGADSSGNVSNFVETEQIITDGITNSSFIQIRGNIPLIWKTKEKDLFKPRGKFVEDSRQNDVLIKHFNMLKEMYGEITVINLLNNNGDEKELHDMYELFVKANLLPIKYFGFDFHKICANKKYQNIEIIMEEIKPILEKNKFYFNNSKELFNQLGIIRTNCIDCLDRTNVIQSSIAKYLLSKQLNLILGNKTLLPLNSLISNSELTNFMNLWADHANVMSYRYTQTDAMKTDFTRKGKREIKGMINDGLISVQRTIISVKTDQYKKPQETLDFIMGKIIFDQENMNEKCNNVLLCIPKAIKYRHNIKIQDTVHLHLDSSFFKEYNYNSKLTRTIPIHDIVRCEMCEENPQQIIILCATDSKALKYEIPSIVEAHSLMNIIGINTPNSTPILINRSSTFISNQITKNITISCIQWKLNKINQIPSQIEIMEFVKEIQSSIVDIVLYNTSFPIQLNHINSVTPGILLLMEIIKELSHQQPNKYEIFAVKETGVIVHCILVLKEQIHVLSNLFYSKVYTSKNKSNEKPKIVGIAFTFNIHQTSIGLVALDLNNEINDKLFLKGNIELPLTTNHLFFITQKRQVSLNELLNRCENIMENQKGTFLYYRNQWNFMNCSSNDLFKYPTIQTIQNYLTNNYFAWTGSIPYVEIPNKTKIRFQLVIKFNSLENIKFDSKEISLTFISKYLQQITESKLSLQQITQGQSVINLKLMQFPQPFLALGIIQIKILDGSSLYKGIIPMNVVLLKNLNYSCHLFSNSLHMGNWNMELSIVACREFSVRLGNGFTTPPINSSMNLPLTP
ncbi:phosphoinositide phosphatase, putative [Entamoeba histolytica HM-1:IMSS-B]|uniref:Phosphoinositide phosphatase, putative n=5 Tax=Entamoeba histolytica TaxID=5759 RepID=C4M2X0_ENTH1|nr:phosphoinositide phosphatase, putative [Entamoeba histolytica HM-1:IMSS]EMD46756.1 phosphoinositide phosphatase, putative [Entamoeba histolytica KU27]EMH73112.1 phosphoinositide phosphatase, putative [Entamoeba histolytica HM-1:IMSS-B]ENY60103.1 phosphoinositide phosphatase, putative [Entamoeba histolytica HM-1:IMSS-A]GAT95642.1 phosphoinositide phosphatase putative [Entamoeba histolytica]EAL47334.1 phosphoinositide phosphatase, putative [Entamoeba histolytica HM-1:IMSS]|eukprot:XP_652720.1 phosphoinositide phosphatase, putative [Entamoeba histolytica HM-1:IMSS]